MHILALDPGESTGYVKADVSTIANPSAEDIVRCTIQFLTYGTWKGLKEFHELVEPLFSSTAVCIVEDYPIYPNRVKAHIGSGVYTLREIGRIEYAAFVHGLTRENGRLVFYVASTAKQAWKDDRLKDYLRVDNYKRQFKHVIDAIRHLYTYLERSGMLFGDNPNIIGGGRSRRQHSTPSPRPHE